MRPQPVMRNATKHSFEMDLGSAGDDENEGLGLRWSHVLGLCRFYNLFQPSKTTIWRIASHRLTWLTSNSSVTETLLAWFMR